MQSLTRSGLVPPIVISQAGPVHIGHAGDAAGCRQRHCLGRPRFHRDEPTRAPPNVSMLSPCWLLLLGRNPACMSLMCCRLSQVATETDSGAWLHLQISHACQHVDFASRILMNSMDVQVVKDASELQVNSDVCAVAVLQSYFAVANPVASWHRRRAFDSCWRRRKPVETLHNSVPIMHPGVIDRRLCAGSAGRLQGHGHRL